MGFLEPFVRRVIASRVPRRNARSVALRLVKESADRLPVKVGVVLLGICARRKDEGILLTIARHPLIVDQPSMLMPGKKGLEKVPYRFSYRYRCAGEPGCHGHKQSIVDWEDRRGVQEMARSVRRGRRAGTHREEVDPAGLGSGSRRGSVHGQPVQEPRRVPRVGGVLAAEGRYR